MRTVRAKNPRLVLAMCEQRQSNRSLAKAVGISPDHFSKILNQRFSPSTKTRAKIASVLGVPASRLFGEVDP